jgi:hypothetical protein
MIFLFGGLSPEPLIDDGLPERNARVDLERKALRWGRLTVIERAGSDQSHGRDQSLALWRCVCSNHVAAGALQGLCEV